MTLEEIPEEFKQQMLDGPMAVETTYECGHTDVSGGNVADPNCEYLRLLGHIRFETKAGTCGHCDLYAGGYHGTEI